MNVLDKLYVITLANGDRWAVPVRVIAEDRAAFHAKKYGMSADIALNETTESFDYAIYAIRNWAVNEMNWSDVKDHAILYERAKSDDSDPFQDAWITFDAEVVDPK